MLKKYKDIFIAITILLFLTITLVICYISANYSQSAHKYSKEAIEVLKDYKGNKIGNTKTISELKSLSYKAKEEYEEKENDTKLSLISAKISNIATSMEIKMLDRLDIEDFIKELKEF